MPSDPADRVNDADRNGTDGSAPRRLGGGEAFLRMAERDPDTRAALQRDQERTRAAVAYFQSAEFRRQLERDRREQQEAIEKLAQQIREAIRATGDELTARGFRAPESLEEWEHLARIVEMPFETIRLGNYTFSDVYVMALAWIERQQLRDRIAGRDSQRPDEPRAIKEEEAPPIPRTYAIAALRELTGLSNTALNEYATKAGATRPGRGQKNFRYAAADVGKILKTIVDHTTETRIRVRCKAALANLEITE